MLISAEFLTDYKPPDLGADARFFVVARTEGLVAGEPLEEAMARADAYAEAGADAIFVHSCKPTPVQIVSFMEQWAGQLPVLISPTTYHATSLEEFARMGIAGVIWANQSMRAALTAMRDVCQQVRALGGVSEVEGQVATLKEVFSLLGYHELEQDEARYAGMPAESEGVAT